MTNTFKTLVEGIYQFLHTVTIKNPYMEIFHKDRIFEYLSPQQKSDYKPEYNPYFWNLCGEKYDVNIFASCGKNQEGINYEELRLKFFGSALPITEFDLRNNIDDRQTIVKDSLTVSNIDYDTDRTHPLNDPDIRVTAVELLNEADPTIALTPKNLLLYPATCSVYAYSPKNLKSLMDSNPLHIDRIRSIFFPCVYNSEYVNAWNDNLQWDDQRAFSYVGNAFRDIINARSFELLAYSTNSLESYEQLSIVTAIKNFLEGFDFRYNIQEYMLRERYAPMALCSILWSLLPIVVMRQRIKNMHTSAAHKDFIWEYLTSHGLSDYRTLLTRDQALFLYKNIRYLKDIRGTSHSVELLVENLLKPYNVTLASKRVIQSAGPMLQTCRPIAKIISQDFNTQSDFVGNMFATVESLDDIYAKEVLEGIEPDIGPHKLADQKKILSLAIPSKLPTKFVELRSRVQQSRLGLYFIKFSIETIIYLFKQRKLNYKVNIQPSDIAVSLNLEISDALGLFYYCCMRSQSSDFTVTQSNYTDIVGKNVICDRSEFKPVTAAQALNMVGKTVIIFGPIKIPNIANLTRPFQLIDVEDIDITQTFRDKHNQVKNLFESETGNLSIPVMDKDSNQLSLQTTSDGVSEFVFYDNVANGSEGLFIKITRDVDGTISFPLTETSWNDSVQWNDQSVLTRNFEDYAAYPRCHVTVTKNVDGIEYVYLLDETPIQLVRQFDGSIPYPYIHNGEVVELKRTNNDPIFFVFDTNNNLQFAEYDADGNLNMPVYFPNDNRLALENIDYFRDVLKISLDKYIPLRDLPADSEETVGVKPITTRLDLLDKLTELFEIRLSDTVALENSTSDFVSEAYSKLYEQITVNETIEISMGPHDGIRPIYETFDDWFNTREDISKLIDAMQSSEDVEESFLKLAYDIIDAIVPLRSSKYVAFARYSKKDYAKLRKLFIQLCTYYITFLGTEISDVRAVRKDNIRPVAKPSDCFKDIRMNPPTARAGRLEMHTGTDSGDLIRYRQAMQVDTHVNKAYVDLKNPKLSITSIPTFGILFNVNDEEYLGDKVNFSCGFDEHPDCRYTEMPPCGFNEIEMYGG